MAHLVVTVAFKDVLSACPVWKSRVNDGFRLLVPCVDSELSGLKVFMKKVSTEHRKPGEKPKGEEDEQQRRALQMACGCYLI